MELAAFEIATIALAAFLIGLSKTSIEVGILGVLMLAIIFPGKASPGIVLPMLIAADVMAVIYYRRSCQWAILRRLIPASAVGVVMGAIFLWWVPDLNFERIIGWIILAMLALDLGLTRSTKEFIRGKIAAAFFGILGGASSMIANAAGPVFGVYLLQMNLNKSEFVGTRGWFFLIMNVSKLPFTIALGMTTPQSLVMNLWFLPAIGLGAAAGILFLKRINTAMFTVLIRVTVLGAALRLVLG